MKESGKKWLRLALTLMLSVSLAVPAALPAYATSKAEIQEEISSLESEQAELESKLAELKENKKDTDQLLGDLLVLLILQQTPDQTILRVFDFFFLRFILRKQTF